MCVCVCVCVCFLWWERSSGDFAVCLTAVDLAKHEGGRGGAEAGPHTRVAEAVNGDGGRGGFRRGGTRVGPHKQVAEAVNGDGGRGGARAGPHTLVAEAMETEGGADSGGVAQGPGPTHGWLRQ